MPVSSIGRGELRVASEGVGSDVLLLGGFVEDGSIWQAQMPMLTRRHRVTRYIQRGLDGTAVPPGPYRLSDLVEDALAVLDAAEIDRAHLIGSSLGGVIAQRLAIEHPERVRTLTLNGSWARADRALRALLSNWLWAAERARGVGELLQIVNRWLHGSEAWNSGAVDEAIAQAAIAEVRAGPQAWREYRDAFTWNTWAAFEHDSTAGLLSVKVPSLVIVGQHDVVLGERYGRELAGLLQGARLEVIAGAGHRPFEERPQVFNGLLEGFLAVAEARAELAA
jgi:3-oxoadipate enol-lactonase